LAVVQQLASSIAAQFRHAHGGALPRRLYIHQLS
jgi:hypothetical protein